MKYLLLVLVFLVGCTPAIYNLKVDCDKVTTDDLFKSISILLQQEGFIIKTSDTKLGYLFAESDASVMGVKVNRIWTFQLNYNGQISANAKTIHGSYNTTTYYNDESNESLTWYWSIRNGLERLCRNKIVFEVK